MKLLPHHLASVILCLCLSATQAGQLGGNLAISGSVQLDSTKVETATIVYLATATNQVMSTTGTFNGISAGTRMSFATNTWPINYSGPITNFWSVGPYTFNLNSSTGTVFGVGGFYFLNISIQGTVTSNGVNPTLCTGAFTAQDPAVDGFKTFSESFSFTAIPSPPNVVANTSVSTNWIIAWPTNSFHSYTLQQNTNLFSTNWVTSTYPITNGFGTNFCTVPLTNGCLFFRLSM